MLGLHSFVENELEYAALAWNSLAWYWAYSFLGMGPRYKEYMNSGAYELDKAFLFDDDNEGINHIYGYGREITIKERFERAVDFFEYCCVRCRETSINPPYDLPPSLDTIVELFRNTEARPRTPDKAVNQSLAAALVDNDEYQSLWTDGNDQTQEEQFKKYAVERKAAINYVLAEVQPRLQLTMQQLNKMGFLTSGYVKIADGVTPEFMDEVMPDDAQVTKLGTVYRSGAGLIVTEGITGRYFKAGHNIERAMWNEQRAEQLSGVYHSTLLSWKQLMELGNRYEECDSESK